MKYKLYDKVWIIPYPNIPFAVLCSIIEVDQQFNNYWLDEPIGHGTQDDELTKSIKIVKNDLFNMIDEGSNQIITLNQFRKLQKQFISNTWTKNNILHPGFPKYSNKIQGKHWLNINNLKKDY